MKVADMTPEQHQRMLANQARYRAGPKYAVAQERFRAKGGRNRLALAHRAKVRAERPEVYAAWKAVQEAIRVGVIVKPTECRCGRRVRLDGHHYLGYSEDHHLDVEWLCRRCHKAAHREVVMP